MGRKLITKIIFLLTISVFSQESTVAKTEKVLRINFLNPALELEIPTGNKSTFSSSLGIGYGGSYPDLSFSANGATGIISPFIDLQQKWFYNFKKRLNNNLNIDNNSGNFVSVRFLTRGKSFSNINNTIRTSNYDFAIGPTWGVQRKYGENFHLLFDVGPVYYFDTKGNGNIFPLILQINLGFDL